MDFSVALATAAYVWWHFAVPVYRQDAILSISGRIAWPPRFWMPALGVLMTLSCVTGCAICEVFRGRWRQICWRWRSATAAWLYKTPGRSKRPRGRDCPPETPPSPQLPSSTPPWLGNNLRDGVWWRQQRQPLDGRMTSTLRLKEDMIVPYTSLRVTWRFRRFLGKCIRTHGYTLKKAELPSMEQQGHGIYI